jgi:hypothetical protein
MYAEMQCSIFDNAGKMLSKVEKLRAVVPSLIKADCYWKHYGKARGGL